jgi:membrane protein implicated in regulation of membrane protease activity
MFDSTNAELLWFIVGLVLLLSELILPGFVIVFFGIGAWITAALVAFGLLPGLNAQLLVFLISSVLSLALFRKKGQKHFKGDVTRAMKPGESLDDIHGQRAVTISPINPNMPGGQVEFHGTPWNAESDTPIAAGQPVEIIGQQSLVLRVKPIS